MKKALIFLLIFTGVALAAVNAALVMPPTGFIKPILVKTVHDATGLDLAIGGRISLRLIPSLNLRLEDVVLSDPAAPRAADEPRGGSANSPLFRARAIEVRADSWPLLRGGRNFERVRLIEPRITVSIDKDGRVSWPLSNGAAQPAATPGGAAAAEVVPTVALLVITGGVIDYRDARDGVVASLSGIDASATGVTPTHFVGAAMTAADVSASIDNDAVKLTIGGLDGTARNFQRDHLSDLTVNAKTMQWVNTRENMTLTADAVSAGASNLSRDATGALSLSSTTLQWRYDAQRRELAAREPVLSVAGLSVTGRRLEQAQLKTIAITYSEGGQSPPIAIAQVIASAPVVALGEPIDAELSLVWNNERLTGRSQLPPPENLVLGASLGPVIPAKLSVTTTKGDIDFEGDITPGTQLHFKGRTKATTPSLADLSKWLGLELPANVTGSASIVGDIDAQSRRIALTNGRISHDATTATGAVTVDLSGARPAITAKMASDKFDANHYLGLAQPPAATNASSSRAPETPAPVQRTSPAVPVKDALKAYMRAMLEDPQADGALQTDVSLADLTRARTRGSVPVDVEWSDTPINLTALRSLDLDVEVAVKSLQIRDFDIAVPRLKAVLKDGFLALDGSNLATRGGHLTGKADIDVRQTIPHVATSFKADGVDVYDLLKSIGVTAVIAGSSNVEADLTGSGSSQKELVETLSGQVKARVGQGSIVGYDFSSIMSWLFGDRTYDPRQRTPFTRLDAAVAFDNGVARDSTVSLSGPVVGGDADGSIKLPQKEIDYRAHFKLSSFFTALSLRIFGEWDRPSVTPDLDVFSRSPAGNMSPTEMLANADLADPELATLIGRVLERAGSRGLPPAMIDSLRSLQARAAVAR